MSAVTSPDRRSPQAERQTETRARRRLAQPWPLLFARNLFLPEDLGGNRYPYEVMRRLGERGHRVRVVTPRLHGRFPALPGVEYRHYWVNRRHAALTWLSNLLFGTLALRSEPTGERHAVALAGSYDAGLALRWSGLTRSIPLVYLYHGELYSEWVQALGTGPRALARRAIRAYMRSVERQVFEASARIVAVSHFSARQIGERSPGSAGRVRVVPTGVDTAYFCPPADKRAAKVAVGVPADRPLLLGVGRLAGVKQFDRLVRGFGLATRAGLSAHLVIAGDGPERPKLERLISALELGEHVQLRGYCDPPALRALMQAADLQVCSSAFENLSLAILESLACGTPVLGTPGGGTPELVGALDPGLVLSDDSPEAIGRGIGELAGAAEWLRELGERARQLAADHYDWERVVDRLEEVCEEVRVR